MLKKDAFEFCAALSHLWLMENICDSSAKLTLDAQQIQDTKTKVKNVLEKIRRLCIRSGLNNAMGPELKRFRTALKSEAFEQIAQRCDHLRNRVLDELANEFYFQVDRQEVQFYGHTELFGEAVAKKFKRAAADIENAGNCLALQQPTACVFHLMRAMEIAVRQLGRRLKVTIMPQTTWRQMTGQMDLIIKKMPAATDAQKGKRNNLEAASINLHHVGSALRNNTMHPAASYTQCQARDVFNATRVFMNGLCDL